MVHRDLKPANIFLVNGQVDDPRVIDFGVARTRKLPQLTAMGSTVGTASYMSPEQARGVADIDGRADIFAMGCVLLECLTGEPTFAGENNFVVFAKICLDEPIPVADLCPGLPTEASRFIEAMLARDRGRRPANAGLLAKEAARLAQRLSDGKPKHAAPSSGQRTAMGEQRAVLLVLAVAGAGDGGEAWRASLEGVQRAWSAQGVMLERIAGDAAVAVVLGAASPLEQGLRAGRLALQLRALSPDARIAVVAGRAMWRSHDTVPLGEVLDRGTQLLATVAPGEVFLDESSAGLLAHHFQLSSTRPPRLLQRRHVGSLDLPILGREPQLAQLLARLEEAERDETLLLTVIASPPGGGKSRVLREVSRRAAAPGRTMVHASTDASSAQRSLSLVSMLLRDAMGSLPEDEAPAAQAAAYLKTLLPAAQAERVMPFFLELCGLFEPARVVPNANGPRRESDRHLGVWLLWIEALLQRGPLVFLIDDLPGIDDASLRLLEVSAQALRHKPVSIVASGRSDGVRLASSLLDGCVLVELPPLELEDSLRFCASTRPDLDEEARSSIATRVAGNPFVLRELLRAQSQSARTDLPATVMALVQARLDKLDPELRRVLRVVAAFGAQAPLAGLCAVLAQSDEVLRPQLEALALAEVLLPVPPGERAVTFSHGIYREVSYASFVEDERRSCHGLVASWLEAQENVDPLILATHLDEAGERRAAVAHYVRAAERAVTRHDVQSVIRISDRAVACGAQGHDLGRIHLALTRCHRLRGDTEKLESFAQAALPLVEPALRPLVICELSFALHQQQRFDEVERLFTPLAQAPIGSVADLDSWYGTCCLMAISLLEAGQSAGARDLLDRYHGLEPQLGSSARGHAAELRAELAILEGRLEDGATELGHAEALLAQAGDVAGALLVRMNRASLLADMAAFEEARVILEAGLTEAVESGLELMVAVVRSNLGVVARRQGRVSESLSLLDEVVRWGVQSDNRFGQAVPTLYLAWSQLTAGDTEAAERSALAAVSLLQDLPARLPLAQAMVAAAPAAQGKRHEALQNAEAAFEAARTGPLDEGEVFVAVTCARLRQACGDRDGAETCVREGLRFLERRLCGLSSLARRENYKTALEENLELARLAAQFGLGAVGS